MKNTFSSQQISKTVNLAARLFSRQNKLKLLSKLPETKSNITKFTQRRKVQQSGS